MNSVSMDKLAKLIDMVMENGMNFFDHADIYGGGECKTIFAMSDGAVGRDGGVLDYCRVKNITIQTWSPFQYGMFEGVFLNSEKYAALNEKLREIAERYSVDETTITIAWILRHPAHMQVLSGTMNAERLRSICKAAQIEITREEWYEIYMAAGNPLP